MRDVFKNYVKSVIWELIASEQLVLVLSIIGTVFTLYLVDVKWTMTEVKIVILPVLVFLFFVVCSVIYHFYCTYRKTRGYLNIRRIEIDEKQTIALCLLRTPLRNYKGIRKMILDNIKLKKHGATHLHQFENGDFEYTKFWEKYNAWVIIHRDANYSWLLDSVNISHTCIICETETKQLCRGCFSPICVYCRKIPVTYVSESEWDKPWPIEKDGTCPYHWTMDDRVNKTNWIEF